MSSWLTVAWLLAALRPSGPYPVLALTGEQGSAKSIRANFLRALVDPNSVPLRALPCSERDVFIAARNSHVLAYDNASGLPDWLSDTFCRLATGGGFSTRELYTDQDEVLFGSKRPIILNGIDDIATRPDLADRSIVQTLAAISDENRRLETELWPDFERKRPRIMGALLTAVSHGLKTMPDVKLDRKPRMADFAQWVTACEGGLWAKGTFMAAYTGNIEEAVETVLENDQVAAVLRAYIDMTSDGFTGTAADLLKALNSLVSETQQKAKGWPRSPAVLAKTLRRIAPPLRKIGIDVAFDRENRQRRIAIAPVKTGETPSQPSPPSFSNGVNGLEETACCQRAVTSEEATVTGDGSGSNGDGDDRASVTANQLKNKDGDGNDGGDGIFSNLSGRHVCAQCHGAPDGKERTRRLWRRDDLAARRVRALLHPGQDARAEHTLVTRRKRHLPPRPPDPPEGMMWWHGELWTIAAVESLAKHVMGNHDFEPRHKRDRANGIIRQLKSLKGRR